MPSSLVLDQLLSTVVIPAAAAALLLALGRWRPLAWLGHGAVVLTAGFLAGYLGVYGRPALPPVQALDWLPAALLVALLLYGITGRAERGVRRALLVLFVAGVVMVLAAPLVRYGLDRATSIAGACLVVGWWAAALVHDRRDDDPAFGIVYVVIAVGAAVIAAVAGSVVLGQLGGVLAAVTAVWLLWSGVVSRRALTPTGRGAAITALVVLLFIGQIYGNTPLWATVLLLALLVLQPAIALLSARVIRRGAPLARLAFTAVLAAMPVAAGVYFLIHTHVQPGEF